MPGVIEKSVISKSVIEKSIVTLSERGVTATDSTTTIIFRAINGSLDFFNSTRPSISTELNTLSPLEQMNTRSEGFFLYFNQYEKTYFTEDDSAFVKMALPDGSTTFTTFPSVSKVYGFATVEEIDINSKERRINLTNLIGGTLLIQVDIEG